MKIQCIHLIACCFIFLFSCTGHPPCDYDFRKFHAEVKQIRPYEEQHADGQQLTYYHVMLEFDQRPLSKEWQYLDKLKNIRFDSILIALNHIEVGNIYTGLISVRTSGDCQPMYVSFDQGFRKDYR